MIVSDLNRQDHLMRFHLNHQGLNSSYDCLSEFCYNVHNIDIFDLTETCLSAENEGLLNIESYILF